MQAFLLIQTRMILFPPKNRKNRHFETDIWISDSNHSSKTTTNIRFRTKKRKTELLQRLDSHPTLSISTPAYGNPPVCLFDSHNPPPWTIAASNGQIYSLILLSPLCVYIYMYLTRGREKLRQPFRSWRERIHDDRSTAHADRNKAITVSILMQRVGVDQANGGGRWRGIVSPPLVGRGVVVGPGRATRSLKGRRRKKKAVFHGIDETSFAMEKRSANERTNERTDGGLSLSREGLCRGSWWTGVCPGHLLACQLFF